MLCLAKAAPLDNSCNLSSLAIALLLYILLLVDSFLVLITVVLARSLFDQDVRDMTFAFVALGFRYMVMQNKGFYFLTYAAHECMMQHRIGLRTRLLSKYLVSSERTHASPSPVLCLSITLVMSLLRFNIQSAFSKFV